MERVCPGLAFVITPRGQGADLGAVRPGGGRMQATDPIQTVVVSSAVIAAVIGVVRLLVVRLLPARRSHSDEWAKLVDELQGDLARLQGRIIALETNETSLRAELWRLQADNTQLRTRLAEAEAALARLRGTRDAPPPGGLGI